MLNILVCCGGGYSSSFMARTVQEQIDKGGYSNQIHAEFYPFKECHEVIQRFDIAYLCPHLRYRVAKMMEEHGDVIHCPLCIIPPKMYGTMRLDDIVQDAVELIEIYHQNPTNPTHFPNEDNSVRVDRLYSHRKTYENIPNNIKEALEKFEAMKKD